MGSASVRVAPTLCGVCGACVSVCPFSALDLAESRLEVDQDACTACGVCLSACPTGALSLAETAASSPVPPLLNRTYDVVVVGAGPAGSTAALFAAKAGARVLLLEKRQEIGSPVRCAEGVGHVPLARFVAPDPRWISATVTSASISVSDGGGWKQVLHKSGATGYILERRVFDRALAETAAAGRAAVLTKATVTGLLREGGRTAGVEVRWRGRDVNVAARVVIAADGVESAVARWAGLDTSLAPHDAMACAQFLLAGIDIDPTCCAYYMGDEHAPGGYAWVFPKGEGRANVGLGVQSDLAKRPALSCLEDLVSTIPALARGSIVTQVFGMAPVAAPLPQPYADGLLVVGDAAHHVDALTGGGITNAMAGGALAGRIAAEACAAGDTSAGRLSAYGAACQAEMGRRLQRNYRLKEKYGSAARLSEDFLKVFALAAAGS